MHKKLLLIGMIALIFALVISAGFSHVALAKNGGGSGGEGQSSGSIGNPGAWGGLRQPEVPGQPWSGPNPP